MKRKLLILNVALLATVVYAGMQFRARWQAAKAREAATLSRRPKPLPVPKLNPLAAAPPVTPAEYAEVAMKMLFDPSRNPNVPIDVPQPKPKPPMPPLPVYHGMMDFGSGPIAIFGERPGAPHHSYRVGDMIGQFKLLSVNRDEISLEWDGEVIRKTVEELARTAKSPEEAVSAAAAVPAPAQAAPPPPPVVPAGPGEQTQFGFKVCAMNDGHAEGEVVDGYRKVLHATPFGKSCTYEPVGK